MSTTKLMVLGAVRIFQPAHGYWLRRELLTWGVQSWANVNPGSIYNALRSLTKDGLLDEVGTDQTSSRPAKTTYQLTTDGTNAFYGLLRSALWEVHEFDSTQLLAALTFMDVLTREEVTDAITARTDGLRNRVRQIEHEAAGMESGRSAPPQAIELHRVSIERLQGELQWCGDFLQRLRDGYYRFSPEPGWEERPNAEGRWHAALEKP